MREKGTLVVNYKQNGQPKELVLEVPLGADESTVLLHILSNYNGPRLGIDVHPHATGVERLRPQVKEIGVTDVEWEYQKSK